MQTQMLFRLLALGTVSFLVQPETPQQLGVLLDTVCWDQEGEATEQTCCLPH